MANSGDGAEPIRTATVIGGTGSVGRQICAALSAAGWRVRAVSRNWKEQVGAYDFVALDVTASDPNTTAELLRDSEVVVNAAGQWGDTEDEMSYSHTRLVEQLLIAVAGLPHRPRLVHIGSIHEYGPVPIGTSIDEHIRPRPVTPYARAKLATSRAVLDAAPVDAIVLRAANICGPYPARESFLAILMDRIRSAFADGGDLELTVAAARRDFIDVRDVARAVVRACQAGPSRGVYNIGTGAATPVATLTNWLLETSEFPDDRVQRLQAPVQSKGGDWTRMDVSRARAVLGWEPTIALRDSIAAMWAAEPSRRPTT